MTDTNKHLEEDALLDAENRSMFSDEEHPADIADAIEEMSPEEGAAVLTQMQPEAAADALGEMDEEDAEGIIEEMVPEAAAERVELMPLDEAADLLAELPDNFRQLILAEFPEGQRKELEELMAYPPDTAGGIMSPEVFGLPANLTVQEAVAELRRTADEAEQVYYTYVVDHQTRLVGVVSYRDLILSPTTAKLHELMSTKIVTVPVMMDQEEVAAKLKKYGLYALPVVADDDRLLGIVTVDDVVEVLEEEATEDMQRMVGAGADERADSPILMTVRSRILWLLVNLGTAFVAALVIGHFEEAIKFLPALAFLMPVVAQLSGNTGAQSMAVVIRGLATGETKGMSLKSLLFRNVAIGISNGTIIGVVAFVVSFLWLKRLDLGLVLGAAMLLCMILASVAGATIPWMMKRLGFDPAQSSSIILTTIIDIAGFGVFLALAVKFIQMSEPMISNQ